MMTNEEIREAIDDLDEEVLLTIIECCKEMYCNGLAPWEWDDRMMEVLDKVLEDNLE